VPVGHRGEVRIRRGEAPRDVRDPDAGAAVDRAQHLVQPVDDGEAAQGEEVTGPAVHVEGEERVVVLDADEMEPGPTGPQDLVHDPGEEGADAAERSGDAGPLHLEVPQARLDVVEPEVDRGQDGLSPMAVQEVERGRQL
jgi:hypothetical protein